MRYAKVRRLEIWLRGPNGLARERLSDAPASFAWLGGRPAEKLSNEAYCDSRLFSMLL